MTKKKRTSIADKVRDGLNKPRGTEFGYTRMPEGVKLYKVEPGSTVYGDIVPYVVIDKNHMDRKRFGIDVGDIWNRRPFLLHRNVGESRDSYVCPRTIGEPCPICTYRQDRIQAKASKEETDALKPSLRHLYVWVPKGSDDHEEVPHIFDISNFCFGRALEDEAKEQDVPNFSDLEGGTTLKCRFSTESFSSKKGKPVEFAKIARIDFEERDYDYPDDFPDTVPNLDEVLVILPYKKLEAIFFEQEEVPEEEEERKQLSSEPQEEPAPNSIENTPPIRTKRGTLSKIKKEEVVSPARKTKITKPPEHTEKPKGASNKKEITEENNVCPYGYVFGVDFEKHSECETACDMWNDCLEVSGDQ